MLGRFTCSCGRSYWKHIATLLRCYEPRGALSCGSPMPRGERIAKPAEWETHLAGPFFLGLLGAGPSRVPLVVKGSGYEGASGSARAASPTLGPWYRTDRSACRCGVSK